MNTSDVNDSHKSDKIIKLMHTEINNIKNDAQIKKEIRKIINDNKNYFINYSFDSLQIKFTSNDIIYINDNQVFSIHSADNLAVYLYINKSCKDILGFDQNFVIGKCLYSFLHFNDLDNVSKKHDNVLKGKHQNALVRLKTNFLNPTKQYAQIDMSIKKIDNIIVTYIKRLNKSTNNWLNYKVKEDEEIIKTNKINISDIELDQKKEQKSDIDININININTNINEIYEII